MILRYSLKLLKWMAIALVTLIVLALCTVGSFKVYQWRKFDTVASLDITARMDGCEEGCIDYKVRSVDTPEFSWLKGKTVNIWQYSDEHTNGLPQLWYDQGYKVFCVTGRLHKAKDHFFWFYPRDVYNFTGSAVHPGMCNNPKAKRFIEK
jgi:hypothetical protein